MERRNSNSWRPSARGESASNWRVSLPSAGRVGRGRAVSAAAGKYPDKPFPCRGPEARTRRPPQQPGCGKEPTPPLPGADRPPPPACPPPTAYPGSSPSGWARVLFGNSYFRRSATSPFSGLPSLGILRSSRGARKPATPTQQPGGKEGARWSQPGRREHRRPPPGPPPSLRPSRPARTWPVGNHCLFAVAGLEGRRLEARRETAPSASSNARRSGRPQSSLRLPGQALGVTAAKSFPSPEGSGPRSRGGWRFLTCPPPAPTGRGEAVGRGRREHSARSVLTRTRRSAPLT